MTIPTLPDVTAETISSQRLATRVLFAGPEGGAPVLFLHGNLSSATWWEEVMVSLPPLFRGIAPDQRGYGEADPDARTDATRGLGDLADDAFALLDALDIDKAHVVGSSMGGAVVWRMMTDAPERLLSVTQVAPGSPYGYGGTKNTQGTPCYPDFAGSGAGLVNPEVVRLIGEQDRSLDSPFGLRAALRQLVYKAGAVPEREEELLSAALSTHLGDKAYPGDPAASPNWPYVAPGVWGVNNGLSPKYAGDVSRLWQIVPKPPLLWIRGSDDLTVSDAAAVDMGALGMAGVIPNWPGAAVYPPQPMLAQTRYVLQQYAGRGGSFREVVMPDTAHAPFVDDLAAFNTHFHAHLAVHLP
jgi:pimeloyl-ACP methyl ester carboxylesterase